MKFVDKYGMNEVVVTPNKDLSGMSNDEIYDYRTDATHWQILTDDYKKAQNDQNFKYDPVNVGTYNYSAYDFDYIKGATWTTDAFYRETKNKIKKFQELGVKTVEMEGASIAAVCKYLNIDYFTFYYAGDNLDSVEWDERSLLGLVNIDKKKEVAILALELGTIINM